MANEKFLNNTGLEYYHNRAKTIFENKIEEITVNGVGQTITNKEVSLSVPEMSVNSSGTTSILQGENAQEQSVVFLPTSNGVKYKSGQGSTVTSEVELASKDYVDANGGKIDKIKVNGTEQTITNKTVDLYVGEMSQEGTPRYNVNSSGLSVKGKVKYVDNSGMSTSGNGTLKLVKDENGVKASALIETSGGMFATGFTDKILPDKDYVDGKGSIAIDSTNNNKTTFTVGSKTSSLATSPDGVIYTEGAASVPLASKSYVDDAVADITGMEFVMVDTLPAEGEKGKIYLVPNNTAGSNIKDEYIWIQDGPNGRFEKIGSTDVDLTDYWNNTNLTAITTAEIDALFA